ncbi:class I SAM-dependent rRNA methyltransferase [Methanococcus voltae]|uniref:23S rRNA (Cytosine1962-C5)-methyltransferase n=1 Tax=Methanococcus voltae TaxID=2188 RepID=A0A8J7RNR6_METVO|nr:class I SAM-dependent rRNA methyltransferase [Methanococcus voltae]MBP2172564.1 23S rRNA (cytosine1962-C5)-methyltransferase [Methanococcus voltae]MBP2201529.1 23S rRNA (cytosine1962-C5)-methyltransferase [Methanococcus voltae]
MTYETLKIDKRAYQSIKNFSKVLYKNAIVNREDMSEFDKKLADNSKNEEIINLEYNDKFVGKAIYSTDFPTIKILTTLPEYFDKDIDYEYFYNGIKKANDYRTDILNYKDTYRMIYAEADSLPTIVLDKYNDIGSMHASSNFAFDNSKMIFEILEELTDITTLGVVKGNKSKNKHKNKSSSNPKYNGKSKKDNDKETAEKLIHGNKDNLETIITEGNVKFKVSLKGHKTGFFLDQRNNRIDLENYVKENDKVLDICSYTGGFAVHAGIKGADVTSVDMSEKALEFAEENMELNGIKSDKYNCICGDAFSIMKEMINKGEKFDVVILDPPAFTDSKKDLKNALNAYNTMNVLGLKLAKRILVTCSCSHHVDREEFKKTVVSASYRAKKEIKQIGDYKTQAPDHVITMANKDLEYLKCLFFAIDN